MASETYNLTTLTTPSGKASVTVTNLGATVTNFKFGDVNVILGYPNVSDYLLAENPYSGATIGRVANRIANAELSLPLAGQESHKLISNDTYSKKGASCLHGGPEGFHQKIFAGPEVKKEGSKSVVTFKLQSPHMDAGFPGDIDVLAIYTLSEEHGKVTLEFEYQAVLDENSSVDETVAALTNHSYFTVSNGPTVEGTEVRLASNSILGINQDTLIPDGMITEHPDVPTGTLQPFVIGSAAPVFDNCFVIDKSCPLDTRTSPLKVFAKLFHPDTKVHLEAATTEPAFQFTTGESMTKAPGLGPRAGFALEAQRYVNAVNNPEWIDQVKLKKGETWGSRTTYTVWEE